MKPNREQLPGTKEGPGMAGFILTVRPVHHPASVSG